MSKLDDLIQEFCPNGIEYKKLLDVAEIVYGCCQEFRVTYYQGGEGIIPEYVV